MNAEMFASTIWSRRLADHAAFRCTRRNDRTDTTSNDPLISLAENYDSEAMATGGIYLYVSTRPTQRGAAVGEYQSDLLVINSATGTVELVERDAPDHVLYAAAENTYKFLDAFVEVVSFYANAEFDDRTLNDDVLKRSLAQRAAQFAGGDRYRPFFETIFGC